MEEQKIQRVVIGKWMNRSRFIQIEDALEVGKVRVWIGAYVKGEGMKENAQHFVDLDVARVILDDVANGRLVEWKDYKGTNNISRVMSVKRDANTLVYWLEIANGPGKTSPTGAVMPAGKPTAKVSVGLPVMDARTLAHGALAYLRAWDARYLLGMKAAECGLADASELFRGRDGRPIDLGFRMNQEASRVLTRAG